MASSIASDVAFQQQQQHQHQQQQDNDMASNAADAAQSNFQTNLQYNYSSTATAPPTNTIIKSAESSSTATSATTSPSECSFGTSDSGIVFSSSAFSTAQNLGQLISSKSGISSQATTTTTTTISSPPSISSIDAELRQQIKEVFQPNDSTSSLDSVVTCIAAGSSSHSAVVSNSSSSTKFSGNGVPTATGSQMLLNGINGNLCNQQQQQQQIISEDDPRTLQLALELSMVGFNDAQHSAATIAAANDCNGMTSIQQHYQALQQQHLQQRQAIATAATQQQQQQQSLINFNTLSALSAAVAAASAAKNMDNMQHVSLLNQLNNSLPAATVSSTTNSMLPTFVEDRLKKSQNMTECVPVPSSEHVAEIVGRQGCKIKALRAKTNTYIKTPVRGEEPVFVVTGRKEDVSKAKREILSAAEHFSLIRATRKPTYDVSFNTSHVGNISSTANSVAAFGSRTPPGPPTFPGQVTIQVRVPYRVVGLVVGPKGATIKHIQQETQTYIVTPSREKDPIFEVTGLPDNVQTARKQIESHIAMRTGNLQMVSPPTLGIDGNVATVHTINTLSQILNEEINADFLASLYKNGICSAFDYSDSNSAAATLTNAEISNLNIPNGVAAIDDNNQLLFGALSNYNNFENVPSCNLGGYIDIDDDMQHNNATTINQNEANIFNTINSTTTKYNSNNNTNINNRTNTTDMLRGNSALVNATTVMTNTNGLTRSSCSSASSTTSSRSAHNSGGSSNGTTSSRPELINIWKSLGDSLDVDEGISESPSIWTLPTTTARAILNTNCSPSTSISPTDSLLGEITTAAGGGAQQTTAIQQREMAVPINGSNKVMQQQQQQQLLSGGNINTYGMLRRECLVCNDKEVTAVLVPCGHNMFCMDCANRICLSANNAFCPVCNQTVRHAMRIIA